MRRFLLDLLKIIITFSLLLVLTFGVWIFYRGTQPMDIPEAEGITFWQFIRERWAATQSVDERISELPQYQGCRNNILYLLPLHLKGAANYAYASFKPESKIAQAFHYWEQKKPDEVLPKVETANLAEVPDAFWRYFERAYWRGLVKVDHLAAECALGLVDFEKIAEK